MDNATPLTPDLKRQFALLADYLGKAQKVARKISQAKSVSDIPDDQAWFWMPEWQAMEREADEDIANGDTIKFDDINEAIKYLHDQA